MLFSDSIHLQDFVRIERYNGDRSPQERKTTMLCTQKPRLRKTGFTLIELLIVIAIIAILAGILFPVFAHVRRSSYQTESLSNLSQIGKAVQMYLADYDENLPPRFPIAPKWVGYNEIILMSSPNGFNERYNPYIKNPQIWYSREDKLPEKGYTSFIFNQRLAFTTPISSIPRPAEAIYVTDRHDVVTSAPPVDTYVWWLFIKEHGFKEEILPGTIDPIAVASHISPIRYTGDLGIYLFLDGHTKALKFEQTWGDARTNLHLPTKP
jgi:prepilin-type N-terminal cleavage/methylation domain-containing protein